MANIQQLEQKIADMEKQIRALRNQSVGPGVMQVAVAGGRGTFVRRQPAQETRRRIASGLTPTSGFKVLALATDTYDTADDAPKGLVYDFVDGTLGITYNTTTGELGYWKRTRTETVDANGGLHIEISAATFIAIDTAELC